MERDGQGLLMTKTAWGELPDKRTWKTSADAKPLLNYLRAGAIQAPGVGHHNDRSNEHETNNNA
jgi:hypothetical protein